MDTLDYLQAVKKRLDITSDYALASALGLTRSAVSKLQARKSVMSDETALRVSEILDLNPLAVLAAASRERNKNPAVVAAWTGIMDKLSVSFNSLLPCPRPRGTLRSA